MSDPPFSDMHVMFFSFSQFVHVHVSDSYLSVFENTFQYFDQFFSIL